LSDARYCRAAEVREVRFHDLRHTYGTTVAASGEAPLRTVQAWMGHADHKTTLRYADYLPGADEAAIIGRAFDVSGKLKSDRGPNRGPITNK
jgi:integrase